jgi:ferric-dicitrate binding protein FerR (iron transport regulator)
MKMELLIKFLNNQCTEAELNEVLRWVNTDALNEDNKRLIFEDWNSYQDVNGLDNDENFTTIFDKIQEKIDNDNQKKNAKASKTLVLSVVTRWITKAAAVLLIPVLSFLFYTLYEKKMESDKYAKLFVDSLEVISPIGSRTVVQLSDGSVVHLNYGSKIKYPQFFSGNTRDVELSGEGFFIIAHNPEKPFIVKAGKLNINAVGTTFNVLAYPDKDVIETTLASGEVVLNRIGQDGKCKTVTTMTPGQHVEYNMQTEAVSSTEGNIQKYILWTEGKLVFEDTPILEVTERLGRMFNVDFEVNDEIKDYIYTVTFIDEPLCQIIDLMTIATPIVSKTLPREKLPDGTFSKPKVILEKRK